MTFVVCFTTKHHVRTQYLVYLNIFSPFSHRRIRLFADFARIAKNGHTNCPWMILQLLWFDHSITWTMRIEIFISGNQNGLGMQRKPDFGPKKVCTDDGISAQWVKILNKIILLSWNNEWNVIMIELQACYNINWWKLCKGKPIFGITNIRLFFISWIIWTKNKK